MEELHKKVLYAFYPDRIHHFDDVVQIAKVSLPFVRNTINKNFVPEGYVEEIAVPRPGKSHNYFRLTEKGRAEVIRIHAKRESMRIRIADLVEGGMDRTQAAMLVAAESIETDIPTS